MTLLLQTKDCPGLIIYHPQEKRINYPPAHVSAPFRHFRQLHVFWARGIELPKQGFLQMLLNER
jgi:hypothetical protein